MQFFNVGLYTQRLDWPYLAKTWKAKKIISLGFDYETGKNSLKAFKEKYLQLVPDAKIIDELWAPLGTTDFTAYITKMANFKLNCVFNPVPKSTHFTAP